jgi:hypothetical protein
MLEAPWKHLLNKGDFQWGEIMLILTVNGSG